mgnify:CR=1 FL=1
MAFNFRMNYNTFMTMQIPFDGLFETFYDNGKKKLEAEYKYGKLNGKFGIWDLDNIKIKEGIYKNDILVSLTKYTYQNNALTVSNFKDSWLHGSQIEYFENGKKKIEVTYKKALIIGKKSEWDENGNLKSEVIYDKYEGDDYDQKEYFSMNSSKKIDSKFEGDNIHLWANWLNADQTEYTDKLLNANRVVENIFWYPNGNKAEEVNFLRCYPNGKTIAWYENGEIFADENYKNNRKHGKWTYWYQGGQLYYEENYKEGLKDGEWLYFDSLGNKTDVKNYLAGIHTMSKEIL